MTAAFAVACLLGGGGATQATAAPEDAIWPIYVDPVNGNDTTGDGHSWSTALKTIPVAVAKSDTADYYNDRRVQVTLAKGTYVLDSTVNLKSRTSLVGDPRCDRSEVVLTAPVDEESGYGVVGSGSGVVSMTTPHDDFVCTLANLTVSNVMVETGQSRIDCGFGAAHDRWSQVVTNVVVTRCANTNDFWSYSAVGVKTGGRALVADCLFTDLRLPRYGMVGLCGNGGLFRNCRIENCAFGVCENGYYTGSGVLIGCIGTLSEYNVVEGCVFSNNTSHTSGDVCVSRVAAMRDCLFVDNVGKQVLAGSWGNDAGGFFTNNPPQVVGCTFLRNASTNGAFGLTFSCGGTVSNCTFSGNSATVNCAGVQNPLEVVDCTFASNACQVSTGSGALFFSGNAAYAWRTPRVANCTFDGNSTPGNGGAIRTTKPVTVEGCLFEGNSAQNGGAVKGDSFATVSNCTFSGNSARNSGGGVCFSMGGGLEGALVADCVFTNNTAGGSGILYGGAGVYADLWGATTDVALTLRNCLFVGNALTNETASGNGSAAILMSRNGGTARFLVESCTMVENRAVCGKPSALYVWDNGAGKVGMTYVTNTVIACNYGADGVSAPAVGSIWGLSSNIVSRIGHSYLHPKTGASANWWTDGQQVTDSNELPAFKPGTWIPSAKSALRDAGLFQAWMTGAFDLQRNADGKAFATRVYGSAPDIGAFERVPAGGFTVIVR